MRYRSKLVGAALLGLSHHVASAAGAEPASLAGASSAQGDTFISIAALTIGYSNTKLMVEGKQPLYCIPLSEGLGTPSELWSLVSKELTGPMEPEYVILALIDQLEAKYPCAR